MSASDAASEPDHVPFGHCAACGENLERPFWDIYCFDCQDRDDEEAEDYEWD